MNIKGYELPDGLYYHEEHLWVKVTGNKARVGMMDFAQKLAGEISYVELPSEDSNVKQDEEVGTIETGKWVGKIYAPVSGRIMAVNKELNDDPTLINQSPYENGWIFEIEMSDSNELKNLFTGEEAVKWQEDEIKKHVK